MLNEFLRTELLFGREAMQKLESSHVAVFGIGGVGGHAAEALARSGIGALDLIDNDTVSLSNLNRQIVALRSTVGRYKMCIRDRVCTAGILSGGRGKAGDLLRSLQPRRFAAPDPCRQENSRNLDLYNLEMYAEKAGKTLEKCGFAPAFLGSWKIFPYKKSIRKTPENYHIFHLG